MFARKVPNRSGSISIQIIEKQNGLYRVVRTVGASSDPDEIERLWKQARQAARQVDPQQVELFPFQTAADQTVQNLVETLSNSAVRVIGPELIFGRLFDRIGLNEIPDELFRHMVIARLAYPGSKLKTVDYLYRYQGVSLSVNSLYASLDRLHSRYKKQVEEIVYQNTRRKAGSLSVVFYDVTTLYFEAEDEDDLRKIGFSKDGKFQHPQIMLGLLVGERGLPIGYDLYEGNTFEGHTLIPILKGIQDKYGFKPPIVVADAAMLSKANLAALAETQYKFIVGARIKNESDEIKRKVLAKSVGMKDGDHFILERKDGVRLLVTYSGKRARKDAFNRKKGITRLRKKVASGRLTKQAINQRGYNKFLTLDGEVTILIDELKIAGEMKWDGLKGYVTNTELSANEIVENYGHLWQIEKAFRISKTDLRVRPIHHYRKRRIESHLCIAFAAYTIYKELEGVLNEHGIAMSAQRGAELTRTMYEIEYSLPDSQERKRVILKMDDEQARLYRAISGDLRVLQM